MVLNYVSRTQEQAKELLLQYLAQNLPEMTDHTLGNPFIRMLHVWLAISEQINYSVDDSASEVFSNLARRYSSLVSHSISRNYRVRISKPSSADVTFELDSFATTLTTIPIGTKISNEDSSVNFWTTELGIISVGSKNVTVKAIQQSLDFSTFSFIPTGAKWQQIAISDSVVDSSVELVNQDGEIWNCVDSLVYSKSNDRHIISTVNQNGISVIQFGDGVTGALPQSNNNLTGKYYTTLGLRGNLKAFEINKIVSTLNIPNLKCYNINEASGGTFADSVQDIRLNLQRLKRTLGTAVTKEDLILATESIQGVLRSGVKIVDGSPIEIYILPVGGGVASNTLKDFVKQKIDSVRVLGRKVQIKQAGVARLKIGLNVRLSSNFSQVEKRQEITAKLLELFSYNNRKVGESVELSDIFQEVEGINGVSSSDVTEMTITPYIRPINGNNTPLNCSISISRNSATTNNWKIQFQSVTRFSVFRNSEFIGAYNILQNVVLNEISFTITGTYLAGQSWEFYSYKGYGSIQLQEQSIVVLEENNISIAFQ